MNESCHAYEWVMFHMWMSPVTHVKDSCHTYEWVISDSEWVLFLRCHRIWMSHVVFVSLLFGPDRICAQSWQNGNVYLPLWHCWGWRKDLYLEIDCNTLQHTATHCHTLQHTATQCNTMQHTATHCNNLWIARLQRCNCCCGVVGNGTHIFDNKYSIYRTATHWQHTGSTLQHTAAHCSSLQHTAAHCNTLQHSAESTCRGGAAAAALLAMKNTISTINIRPQHTGNTLATHWPDTATLHHTAEGTFKCVTAVAALWAMKSTFFWKIWQNAVAVLARGAGSKCSCLAKKKNIWHKNGCLGPQPPPLVNRFQR